jgi:hypothetical protein
MQFWANVVLPRLKTVKFSDTRYVWHPHIYLLIGQRYNELNAVRAALWKARRIAAIRVTAPRA